MTEAYKVDIGASAAGTLGGYEFEGATKQNRPELEPGDVVHARLSLANKDMDPELSCVMPNLKSDGLGQLKDGILVSVSLSQARKYWVLWGGFGGCAGSTVGLFSLHRLLMPSNPLVAMLARHMQFELCVGTNGRVWVKAASNRVTVLAANALRLSDSMPLETSEELVKVGLRSIRK